MDITILGAGVLGLSSALQLADKGHKITIFAHKFPQSFSIDYTSDWAGANWRSVCSNDDLAMQRFEGDTLKHFLEMAKTHPQLVRKCMSYDIFDPREPDDNDARMIRKADVGNGELPWFATLCNNFKVLKPLEDGQAVPTDEREILPEGAAFGIAFETVTLNAPAYVQYLLGELRQRDNVNIVEGKVDALADLPGKVIINCSGLGAKYLTDVQDANVYPTRGQTVLVKNTTNLVDTWSRVGEKTLSYLIPRPGTRLVDGHEEDAGLIVGGCQQPNCYNAEVDEELAETMLEWARTLYPVIFPADHKFEIIRHNVGLRPSRKGGVRVEADQLKDGRPVVHAYGIGGWGFQSSWGIAMRVAELVALL
ncbi:FAD dependent oxidoreductase [Protomyces lactucae-debilis]|uniref:FAD dependent oxidoreductase n=1 Tax=Protomyces lactucae-debilis TaxID=2754530 RepID=A0A1Y2FGH3_PROLT|nr:FAD dependent oxidoreductase [Protomyces lactucae-debilis]ORY83022.1 FAD dependent oxidoreductase [Protomyces lactucae-debilis]